MYFGIVSLIFCTEKLLFIENYAIFELKMKNTQIKNKQTIHNPHVTIFLH